MLFKKKILIFVGILSLGLISFYLLGRFDTNNDEQELAKFQDNMQTKRMKFLKPTPVSAKSKSEPAKAKDEEASKTIAQQIIDLVYKISLAKAYVGKAQIKLGWNNKEYQITSLARAAGGMKLGFKDKLFYLSSGKFNSHNDLVLSNFSDIVAKAKGKKKEKLYEFDAVGKFNKFYKDNKLIPLDAKIFENALDPQSAVFYVGYYLKKNNHCNISHNVFLGERGIEFEVHDKGQTNKKVPALGKGKIALHSCEVIFKSRAGEVGKGFLFAHEKNSKTRANLVRVGYIDKGYDFMLPVFVEVKDTGLGDAVMVLDSLK